MKAIDTLKAEIEKDLREQDNGLAQGTLTPIPLEQIKPVVIGYQRVFASGNVAKCTTSKSHLSKKGKLVGMSPQVTLHSNGKPRFRLVYDYGVKS